MENLTGVTMRFKRIRCPKCKKIFSLAEILASKEGGYICEKCYLKSFKKLTI